MEHDTFRNKLSKLTQKTRKALRLYSSSGNSPLGHASRPLGHTSKSGSARNRSTQSSSSPLQQLSRQPVAVSQDSYLTNGSFPTESEHAVDSIDYSVLQVQQWKEVTRDLLQKITPLLTISNNRKLVIEFYGIRDQFYNEWRLLQADLHTRQLELEAAAEGGEFVKCVNLSVDLVSLKARMQACQAAHNELQRIIENSKVSSPTAQEIESQRIEEEEEVAEEAPHYDPDDSNVIPLRRRNY